jgi:cell division protein FtsI (penicillin-binding protein 3)
VLAPYQSWRPIGQATLAYGYGLSMTPLQLAQAYAVLAAEGLYRPVSLVRIAQAPIARRVVSPQVARDVLSMLEQVVTREGTGLKAAVTGYRVAGKTGTARKLTASGYSGDRHTAVFAGVTPVDKPRFAIVVVVDDPRGGVYYGGDVAAPVFSTIATGALRIFAVPPDGIPPPEAPRPVTLAANRP